MTLENLFECISNRNLETFSAALDEYLKIKGATINDPDGFGGTLLMHASEQGSHKMVALLLRYGADKEMMNRWDGTAMMVASQNGHIATVTLLVNEGAAIDKANKKSACALTEAAEARKGKLVNFLIAKNANVEPFFHMGLRSEQNMFNKSRKLAYQALRNVGRLIYNFSYPVALSLRGKIKEHNDSIESRAKMTGFELAKNASIDRATSTIISEYLSMDQVVNEIFKKAFSPSYLLSKNTLLVISGMAQEQEQTAVTQKEGRLAKRARHE